MTAYTGYLLPFSAAEFLKKIVQLLEEREGYVTPDAFETIFGVSLVHRWQDPDGSFHRALVAGEDWYLSVGLTHTPRSFTAHTAQGYSGDTSLFTLSLADRAFIGPSQCITARLLHDALIAAHWHTTSRWSLTNQSAYRADAPDPKHPQPSVLPSPDVTFRRSTTAPLPRLKASARALGPEGCIYAIAVDGGSSP